MVTREDANKKIAFDIAQARANRIRKRIAVYTILNEPDPVRGSQERFFFTTPDRPDFPDEWVIVGFADPE